MRKAAGVLCALALVVPVGVVTMNSVGAATPTTQCKTLTGKQTYTPALPLISSTKVVTSKVSSTSKIGGCVGGGVTSGTATASSTYKGNCKSFAAGLGKPTKGTASIKWSNGKTTSVQTTLTSKSKPGASPVIAILVSKFVSGQFSGHTSTVTLKATGNAGAKTCISAGLSFFNFVNSGPIKST
jgi:hypothetical protein